MTKLLQSGSDVNTLTTNVRPPTSAGVTGLGRIQVDKSGGRAAGVQLSFARKKPWRNGH
jgi:hypothetical protein